MDSICPISGTQRCQLTHALPSRRTVQMFMPVFRPNLLPPMPYTYFYTHLISRASVQAPGSRLYALLMSIFLSCHLVSVSLDG